MPVSPNILSTITDRLRLVLFAALLLLAWSEKANAQLRAVALTFDDLPSADITLDASEAAQINQAILDGLDRHHAVATGFVIGQRVQTFEGRTGTDILQQWVARGHDLGNHSYTHRDLNDIEVVNFARELSRTDEVIRPILQRPRTRPLYFRFPQNHTGDTPDKRAGAARILAEKGYELAVCTIDNSDYVFANAYSRALARRDSQAAEKLRKSYVEHTAAIIDYYVGLHRQVFGRETAHVMLLHVNRINADVIDAVLGLFDERGFRFVSLSEAQSDPAYRTPDTVTTKFGPMWGYRWARSLGVAINGKLEPEPPQWVTEYAR